MFFFQHVMFAPLVTQVPGFLTRENQFPNICNMKVGSALYFMLYTFYATVFYTSFISNYCTKLVFVGLQVLATYCSHHPGANKDTSSVSYVTK